MHELLTRWYRALLQVEPAAQEAETRMQRLHSAINEHGPIFRLAENPLLLLLMAAMQKYGIQLPRERAELYDTITLTLLKYRELAKDLPAIDEDEAVRRLGPLAYAMQTTENIADGQAVKESLRKTIREERARSVATRIRASDPASEQDEIEKQVENFLALIRERSHLFVQRTSENFSFFHKSFQEYFAARYLLSAIQRRRDTEITHFVELARQTDDIWWEPFLFAVGYQCSGRGRDQTIASDLLQRLLEACNQESNPARRLHDLLLAADAFVEVKAQTFDEKQEKQIAQELLQVYLEAQRQEKFDNCQKIELAFRRWLHTLSSGESSSPLLLVFCEVLKNLSRMDLQRATLTLLVMILPNQSYPQQFYETLLPHLLGLAGLPALNEHYQPVPPVTEVDYTVADLALVALSRMGYHGPAGLLLGSVRQHFEREPEQLRLLALYSLESRMPLMLYIVSPNRLPPCGDKIFKRWQTIQKRREHPSRRTIYEDLPECLTIQQELLDCAEQVCYPTLLHLLAMLKASHMHLDQAWQDVWQAYMMQQLIAPPSYIYYQEIVFLWENLFPGDHTTRSITEQIFAHFTHGKEPYNRFAQHFLATLGQDLRNLRKLRILDGSRDSRDLRNPRDLSILIGVRDLKDFGNSRYLRDLKDYSVDWSSMRVVRIYYLKDLRNTFFVTMIAKQAMQSLSVAGETEAIDLCTILLGCTLQVQEIGESLQAVVGETQCFVDTIIQTFAKTRSGQKELREALLDILRYLPARSSEEIAFVCHMIESSDDEEVQRALALALHFAHPLKNALPMLQAAASSTNVLVATAAQIALTEKKYR